jgi:hypothetical protein
MNQLDNIRQTIQDCGWSGRLAAEVSRRLLVSAEYYIRTSLSQALLYPVIHLRSPCRYRGVKSWEFYSIY